MNHKLLFILLALLAAFNAAANDAVFTTKGNQLEPMQKTNISVVKEILTLNVLNDGMTNVDVYYEFYNPGKAQDVLMGFESMPSQNDQLDLKTKQNNCVKNFTVQVNGKYIKYKNEITLDDIGNGVKPIDLKTYKIEYNQKEKATNITNRKNGDDYVPYTYVYYFTAHFKQGKNIIHHTYKYKNLYGPTPGNTILYKLSPAGRWANHQINDFTLRLKTKNGPKKMNLNVGPFLSKNAKDGKFKFTKGKGKMNKKDDYYEIYMPNGTLEYHATNYKPDHELELLTSN